VRPDTRAHRWAETVSEEEKGRRLTHLIDVQRAISGELNDTLIGREVEVLVEDRARRDRRQLTGKTPQFKTVVLPDDGTPIGGLARVRIAAATTNTLIAAGAREEAGFDAEAAGASLSDPTLVQIR